MFFRNYKSFLPLILLPVFFVLHGFVENYGAVPLPGALTLIIKYSVLSLLTLLFYYILLKKIHQATLMTFCSVCVYLFFGFILEAAKAYFPSFIFSRYSFLVPFLSLILLLAFIILYRKKYFFQVHLYLNLLFLTFILVDLATLIKLTAGASKMEIPSPGKLAQLAGTRPDIYVLMLDEYAGAEELEILFHFDNQSFYSSLAKKGFKITKGSISNYDYTPYSIASMLNMQYLDTLRATRNYKKSYNYVADVLNKNQFIFYLESLGYQFYNHSVFTIAGQIPNTGNTKIPIGTDLISRNTFWGRFEKDILFNLALKWKVKSYIEKDLYAFYRDNNTIYSKTMRLASKPSSKPKIVYTHLIMPHDPYYNDEKGNLRSYETLIRTSPQDKDSYISYLKFANYRTLALIDHILKHSPKPPVILLLSDHGFRHFRKDNETQKYMFSNLQAILLPERRYNLFQDSISNVNLLRIFLNNSFKENLPLLKDTLYHIPVFD